MLFKPARLFNTQGYDNHLSRNIEIVDGKLVEFPLNQTKACSLFVVLVKSRRTWEHKTNKPYAFWTQGQAYLAYCRYVRRQMQLARKHKKKAVIDPYRGCNNRLFMASHYHRKTTL